MKLMKLIFLITDSRTQQADTRMYAQDQLKKRLSETSAVESVSKRMKISTENRKISDQMEDTEKAQMSMVTKIFSIPVIVEEILRHLSPSDIKTVARVCRMWNISVEQAKYWTWAKVRLSRDNFEEIFPTRRFRNIATVKMVHPCVSAVQLGDLLDEECGNRRFLDFGSTDLSSVPADILSEGIVNLRRAGFENAKLTPDQAKTLFLKIKEKTELKLRFLKIRFDNLSSVSPDILTKAVMRLEEVNVGYTHLTSKQVNTLMRTIQGAKLSLRKLIIGGNDLSSVSPDILSQAMVKLKAGNLVSTYLSRGQMNALNSIGFYNY